LPKDDRRLWVEGLNRYRGRAPIRRALVAKIKRFSR
jgi:hypothetical protein